MKSSKKFVCLLIIVCLLFCSCSSSPSSFIEAYEQNNSFEMIKFAVKDDLLKNNGFEYSSTKIGAVPVTCYSKTDNDKILNYYYGHTANNLLGRKVVCGDISVNIEVNEVTLRFFDNTIYIVFTGEHVMAACEITYNFEPIDDKLKFRSNSEELNEILRYISLEKIKLICKEYDKLTDEVMTDIYINLK